MRERVLTYAEERAVAGLERKKSYWELSQASLMKWNKKDFLSKAFENNCLFLVYSFDKPLAPPDPYLTPLLFASLLGTLVNVNSYFLIRLGTICLTSSLGTPPGSSPSFVPFCVHPLVPLASVHVCVFLACPLYPSCLSALLFGMIPTPCSVSFSTSVCFSPPFHRFPFPHFVSPLSVQPIPESGLGLSPALFASPP